MFPNIFGWANFDLKRPAVSRIISRSWSGYTRSGIKPVSGICGLNQVDNLSLLDCGCLHNGFARVKYDDCGHEYLVAFPASAARLTH